MSKRESTLYLQDILISIVKIEGYIKGLSREAFYNNEQVLDAVVRNLEIIGEAANNVPKEILIKYPNIPWSDMVSMRNKILHEYFGVDEEIVWKTITEDLPELKIQITAFPESSKE